MRLASSIGKFRKGAPRGQVKVAAVATEAEAVKHHIAINQNSFLL